MLSLSSTYSRTRDHWQVNTASIIVDASKYIEELKERVEKKYQDVATSQDSSDDQNALPVV